MTDRWPPRLYLVRLKRQSTVASLSTIRSAHALHLLDLVAECAKYPAMCPKASLVEAFNSSGSTCLATFTRSFTTSMSSSWCSCWEGAILSAISAGLKPDHQIKLFVLITASFSMNWRTLDEWFPPDSLQRLPKCRSILSDRILPSNT